MSKWNRSIFLYSDVPNCFRKFSFSVAFTEFYRVLPSFTEFPPPPHPHFQFPSSTRTVGRFRNANEEIIHHAEGEGVGGGSGGGGGGGGGGVATPIRLPRSTALRAWWIAPPRRRFSFATSSGGLFSTNGFHLFSNVHLFFFCLFVLFCFCFVCFFFVSFFL